MSCLSLIARLWPEPPRKAFSLCTLNNQLPSIEGDGVDASLAGMEFMLSLVNMDVLSAFDPGLEHYSGRKRVGSFPDKSFFAIFNLRYGCLENLLRAQVGSNGTEGSHPDSPGFFCLEIVQDRNESIGRDRFKSS